MPILSLTKEAQKVINNYIFLPFSDKKVSCPYYNNRHQQIRGALFVRIGKGTPEEIVDEAKTEMIKQRKNLESMTNDDIKKILVDNNIGIDCSGLAYHILDAELKSRKNTSLKNQLSFSHLKNPIRRIIARLRAVGNTNVKTLAADTNSRTINTFEIEPGDMIIMQDSGRNHDRDHILIVHSVEKNDKSIIKINYTHALDWRADGLYNHGVRQGTIEILDPKKSLTDQIWIESGKAGEENETLERAIYAKTLLIRRLKAY
ncbi:MAG: hypothetical protein KBD73_03725 [Candidatus Magasanikbacteria bacterium]|nr:hypothetical protein [Candidatus Magasanikbacteria bacterium]